MSLQNEIANLVTEARGLSTRAQAVIDLGASPDAMAVILNSVLKTGDAEVNVVIEDAVNTAITQQTDVATSVETAITAAIDEGKISGVTQTQVDDAVDRAAQEGGTVSTTVTARLNDALAEKEVDVDGEMVTERGVVAEAIHQSMRDAIDGGSVETPGGAANRAKQEIEQARSIGGIDLSDVLTVNDRIDMGVVE